jgi:tetratricopeptide (TPR) repeat protein
MSARRASTALAVTLVLAAVTLAPVRAAHADTGRSVPVGPRAIAMGGAFSAIADDGSAPFWNPAGLSLIGHQEFFGSHADLFGTGLRDNYGAFVLPLALHRAVAAHWYHSGYDDGELGFGEDRLGLSFGTRVHPRVALGATLRLTARGTDLDGASVRSGHGTGLDMGLLVTPSERLRLALVAQDAFDTRLRYGDGTTVTAYRRNLRWASSYAFGRAGTLAFDVDDRWHVGGEVWPLEMFALRAGAERDLAGGEGATLTFGAAIKAKGLRFDYARVQHPVLDATDHFSVAMEFNFNPPLIRVEKVRTHDLFASLYKSYARDSFGVVVLRNLQDQPLQARLSVSMPGVVDGVSEQDVLLRPGASQAVPLTAVISDRVMATRGDRPVPVQITATYQSRRLARRDRTASRLVLYGPGAIQWGEGVDRAAAFVTVQDPEVAAVAREAGRRAAVADTGIFRLRNVAHAAAIVNALRTLGMTYMPDPNNPFSTISENAVAIDNIQYPYETLDRLVGDCDDSTVLLASLLENVGIATRFVDAPGHIFLLMDAGVHERNRLALGVPDDMLVVDGDQVWLPLETTLAGKGFAEAWRAGAEAVRSWGARGQLRYVDVEEAIGRFEPAIPPGDRRDVVLDGPRLAENLASDARVLEGWRAEYLAARYGASGDARPPSAGASIEMADVYRAAGQLAEARRYLEQALAADAGSAAAHNDIAMALVAAGAPDSALAHLEDALALDARDAGVWLNHGALRYVLGDSAAAWPSIARGVALAGGVEAAAALLGLEAPAPEGQAESREGVTKVSAEELRRLLESALRRAPAMKPPAERVTPARAPRQPRVALGTQRAGAIVDLSRFMYWKR